MVTERFEIAGEVVKEETYPVTNLEEIDSIGASFQISGFENTELTVRFIFDPPLAVPQ